MAPMVSASPTCPWYRRHRPARGSDVTAEELRSLLVSPSPAALGNRVPAASRAQHNAIVELLRIAPVADELAARFTAAGHRLYLVGGSVRDALLGRLGSDLDFTTDARPEAIQAILAGWEAFARTCGPASGAMNIDALRDHANEMLTVIARDLDTPQTGHEQAEKSKGNAPAEAARETAAEKHGAERAESGFTIEQMVSEYRALRASVIRLWTKAQGAITAADLADLTRFNEAIDQSIAESITQYTHDLDQSKEMFLAILGHDLRSPIATVISSAKFMLETKELKEPHLTLTSRIASSSERMLRLVGDLLDFTRGRLGGGIPIDPEPMNMGKAVQDVVDALSAAHPKQKIKIVKHGVLKGEWDCSRIMQVLTNLIGNALEHGSDKAAIEIDVQGEEQEVVVAVHNVGATILPEELVGIFNPMKGKDTKANAPARGPLGNLGLGLYIADRIVRAHKGRIEVESTDAGGTTFTIHLPRSQTRTGGSLKP